MTLVVGPIVANKLSRHSTTRAPPSRTGTITSIGRGVLRCRGRRHPGGQAGAGASGARSSGLPSRSIPSSSSTRTSPCPNRRSAWADTVKPRARRSTALALVPGYGARARMVEVPFPSRCRIGSASGSAGCHAHPTTSPPSHSTQPSNRRIEAKSTGLPTSGRPSATTASQRAPRHSDGSLRRFGLSPGSRRLRGEAMGAPSRLTTIRPPAEPPMVSSPWRERAHHPEPPAARTIASAATPASAGATKRPSACPRAAAASPNAPQRSRATAKPCQASRTSCVFASRANRSAARAGSRERQAAARASAIVPSSGAMRAARSSQRIAPSTSPAARAACPRSHAARAFRAASSCLVKASVWPAAGAAIRLQRRQLPTAARAGAS